MINSPEILKVLLSAPLFHGISGDLLVAHLHESRLEHLTTGHILLVPGQSNSTIYIVLNGRLHIQSKAAEVEPFAILGAGECVGEMSMLGGAPVSAYVIAATECKLLAINHAAMWQFINSSHAASHNMLNILTSRIRNTNQIVAESLEQQLGFSGEAMVDELTGLYNPHYMHEKFERHLLRSSVDNTPCCVLVIEMDYLKDFCDKYGQLGGDQALRNIAYITLSCLRPNDQAGLENGEKFAIFLPNTSLAEVWVAAERIREVLGQSLVVLPSGDALPAITVSIGISQAYAGDTLDSIFVRTDRALQIAQSSGGNCVKSME